ncbi:MAG: transaldolase [Kiritimatiellales bacterium]
MDTTEQVIPQLRDLKIKIFSDGADLDSIAEAYQQKVVRGFTTNPTLMAKAGVTNYISFAREMLKIVPDLPVSLEVFSDDFDGMRRQARVLNDLAPNVYVKIPVTNTKRESACPLIHELAAAGVKLNITAILSLQQVRDVVGALTPGVPSIVSVFAGRIADSGRDPVPLMNQALEINNTVESAELLWASPREPLNILQAERLGCHIITVTPELLAKSKNFGKSLDNFSLETVKMFYSDAVKSGFKILDND